MQALKLITPVNIALIKELFEKYFFKRESEIFYMDCITKEKSGCAPTMPLSLSPYPAFSNKFIVQETKFKTK